nr:MAG TPA: hypothetical protein [Caudoviricetes sp.]
MPALKISISCIRYPRLNTVSIEGKEEFGF